MEAKKKKLKIKYKLLIIILGFLLILYLSARFLGSLGLIVKEYKITNNNVPDSFHGLKIVHFSDIHYGRNTKEKELKRLITKINEIEPDLVIFTGDLIDKDRELTNNTLGLLIDELSKINAKLGKYAIMGEDDYTFGSYSNILEKSNFTLLINDYDIIYNESYEPIFIGGLDSSLEGNPDIDIVMDYFVVEKPEEEVVVEEKIIPSYKIILMHEPDYISTFINDYNIDLVLAGHSHNGQIRLPIIGGLKQTKGSKTYNEPYYKIKNTDLYISSGIGNSDFNLRLFNTPSFNFYRLTKK